ncbi:SDR family oxidoreductase [Orrella marina]|uniref:Short-chain dehydrogenase n=1 Tax=Orrella marina TaxID=2163011 RepID=A0A2R4XGQ1_9BURK|nr:SDR family oxidoreductase [Orrella marina]AWB33008.1 short-chain dehydrogenase [Orrella marina]
MDLKGRRVLITGASKGLGFEAARELSNRGASIAMIARNTEALESASKAIQQARSGEVLHYSCDVSKPNEIDKVCRAIDAEWGGIDILVNNAGGSSRGRFETLSDEQWQADFDVKLFSTIRFSRWAISGMKERRWGRIMNVVNTLAKSPEAGSAPTSVTRAAGVALTKVMANEFAAHNILVNALCIGRIESEQWKTFHVRDAPHMPYDEYLKEQGSKIPMGRLGYPTEFSGLVALLASDSGGYITGTAINIDGGLCPTV